VNDITTRKRRTWLQSQAKKSKKKDSSCRDFIITSKKMISSKIMKNLLDGRQEYLPSEDHPYDHYFIKATISI